MPTPSAAKQTCFVISPIGEEKSPTRDRSDKVFKYVIAPPAEACGYDPKRADHIDKPGVITSQVIELVVEAPLVIADLTERNPNVFYELALRHAVKKPLVQLIRKDEAIPFDVAGTRIVRFDINDLDSVDQAKRDIERQIRAVQSDPTATDNPISMALDLKSLRKSEDPKERSLADVMTAVTDLSAAVNRLNERQEVQVAFMNDIVRRQTLEGARARDVLEVLSRSASADERRFLENMYRHVESGRMSPLEFEREAERFAIGRRKEQAERAVPSDRPQKKE